MTVISNERHRNLMIKWTQEKNRIHNWLVAVVKETETKDMQIIRFFNVLLSFDFKIRSLSICRIIVFCVLFNKLAAKFHENLHLIIYRFAILITIWFSLLFLTFSVENYFFLRKKSLNWQFFE